MSVYSYLLIGGARVFDALTPDAGINAYNEALRDDPEWEHDIALIEASTGRVILSVTGEDQQVFGG